MKYIEISQNYIEALQDMDACPEAIQWLQENQFPTLQDAWDACERGDWMMWLISGVTNRADMAAVRHLTLAKARCAKLISHVMTDTRSEYALAIAEQFGLENATRKELNDACFDAERVTAATTEAKFTAAIAVYVTTATYAEAVITLMVREATLTGMAEPEILARCADEIRTVYPHAPKLP